MLWYVYESWTHDRAIVHRGDCSYCNDGKGRQAKDSSKNGHWIGPFDSFEAAMSKAKDLARETTMACSLCGSGKGVANRRTSRYEAAGAGFGDRPREYEYAPLETKMTSAPETKMAGPPKTGARQRRAPGDVERLAEDWLGELQDFMERTVTFASDFDPCEPAVTPEEWAAMEAEMEAEWDELYGPAVKIAPDKDEKKKSRS